MLAPIAFLVWATRYSLICGKANIFYPEHTEGVCTEQSWVAAVENYKGIGACSDTEIYISDGINVEVVKSVSEMMNLLDTTWFCPDQFA